MAGAGRLYLVGFMGAGKSAIGRRLATGLGWRFEDTDERVTRSEGRSIEELFEQAGEGRFREAERRALREIAAGDDVVVATGGGLFLSLEARRLMARTGVAVWLDAAWEVVRARLGEGRGRPRWYGKKSLELRALFEKRRAVYALARLRVDASGADPEAVAEAVAERWRALVR